MASSSTSSIQKSYKYDVFLSFRGTDTRKNFIDHLYIALKQKGINTFKDDETMRKGKRLSDELTRSIEDSKFYIIVFSKNYASSSWCLEELVRIMECQKMNGHTAYPIFYDVEPTEVRKQSGSVGVAFARHEKEEASGKWRDALREAADLAGWELKNTLNGHEARFIQMIVEEISLELRFIDVGFDGKLVGMKTRVKDVISFLNTSIYDVRMIGIKGMGGGGKTTLARAIFDQISMEFEGSSFVENVREVSNDSSKGLKSLQKQVLLDVLNDQGISVSGVSDGKNKMKRMLCCRKVLVVLDDVDHVDQLEALAGELSWFKPGSRVIITTRDEQVLVAHQVNIIVKVNLLSNEEAMCLFSRYAFGKEVPIQGYEELSKKVVCYAAGLPLTVKVLGSFLCGKSDDVWRDALERLKTIPLKETLDILELSYNGLEDDYREIFLDVACILKGWEKDEAIRALESCGYHAKNGLKVLEQKSLITISRYGYLVMHDQIEEMGMNIVRRLHPDEPYKHSRLWIEEEIEDIMVKDLGTEATRYICLWNIKLHPATIMKGLANMKELKFLYVDGSFRYYPKFYEDSQFLSNALRFLCWYRYPFTSLPKISQVNNLVGLQMHYSSIIQLWEGGERKVLKKIKFIDLSNSNLRTLDLGLIPNVETLVLRACVDLVELDMRFGCQKLRLLDLSYSKLKTLDFGQTPNLEILNLKGCEDLVEFHMLGSPKLKFLNLSQSKLRIIHLGLIPNLAVLLLEDCDGLEELHMPVRSVKLKSFELTYSKLRILNLSQTQNLERLDLRGCEDLVELQMPCELKSLYLSHSKLKTLDIVRISNLKTLYLDKCSDLVELRMPHESPMLESLEISLSKLRVLHLGWCPNLEKLSLPICDDLEELHLPIGSVKLQSFELSHSNVRILDLSRTQNLERLDLRGCLDLVELHMPIELKSFYLSHSKLKTLDLARISNLETLYLDKCSDLVELRLPHESLMLESLKLSLSKLRILQLERSPNLEELSLKGCDDLDQFRLPIGSVKLKSFELSYSNLRILDLSPTQNLERLDLRGCGNLVELHMPVELKSLYLSHSKLKTLDLARILNLEKLYLYKCLDLVELHMPLECLKFKSLKLSGSILKTVDLVRFLNLQTLYIKDCTNLESFLGIICDLRYLKKLTFEGSILEVPKDLSQLECLEELFLSSAKIKHLPNSICMMKHLKVLRLEFCRLLEQLPEDLGRLECLEELIVTDTKIKHLPNSICTLKHLKVLRLEFCRLLLQLPKDVGGLECLEELVLSSTKIQHLPNSICMLKHLKVLRLEVCRLLEQLPENLGKLECLEELIVLDTKIQHLPNSICNMKHLKLLNLEHCWLLQQLPEGIGRLKCLEDLDLSKCISLLDIPNSICEMKRLKHFNLLGCFLVKGLPEELGLLDRLERINIDGTSISHLPHSLSRLEGLRIYGQP